MKNIYILSTDKASRLIQAEDDELMLLNELYENTYNINKHIYITSDEEIKDDEWHLHYYEGKPIISKSHNGASKVINEKAKRFGYKKIILTTDDQLIKDGVQDIDNEFLEWFAKNPSCEYVKVEKEHHTEIEEVSYEGDFQNVDYIKYKVIIPKEESKQELSLKINDEFLDTTSKEILYTLMEEFDNLVTENSSEETLEDYVLDSDEHNNLKSSDGTYLNFHRQSELLLKGAKLGAKWQQEQDKNLYSEEDLLKFGAFVRIEDKKEKRLFLIQDYFKKWKQI